MKNIRVVFEQDSGFGAWLIRTVTGFAYNHVALIYDSDDWQHPWVTEATTKGVRAVPEKNRIWRKTFRVKHEGMAQAMRETAKHFGENYDYVGLVVFGWVILCWRLFKIKIRHPLRSFKGQFCSEFIARTLNHLWPCYPDPQYVEVRDVWRICTENPEVFAEEAEPKT